MHKRTRSNACKAGAALVALAMVVAACGGDDDDAEEPATQEDPVEEPAEEPADEPAEEPVEENEPVEEPAEEPAGDTTDESTAEGPNADAESIMIGGTYPLTGALATDGQEMANAIQIAFDDVNEAGGIASLDGAAIEFEVIDSEGAPELAATNVQSLIDDGAAGIIGAWLSSNTLATTQVAERAGVPHIVDQSLSDEILSRGFEYTFRVMFSPESVGREGARWLQELIDLEGFGRTAAFLYEDSPFGSTNHDAFLTAIDGTDIEVVASIPYAASTTDLSAEVAQAISSDADLLLSVGYGPDSLLLLQTLDEQGAEFDAIVGVDSAGWYNDRFAEQAGDLVEGVFDVASYPVDHTDEQYDEFVADYTEAFGVEPSDGAVMSYVSARVLAEAIDTAGTTDPEAIRETLATGTFDSHMLYQDSISFDDVGQNAGAAPIAYQYQNGHRLVVLPAEIADADIITP